MQWPIYRTIILDPLADAFVQSATQNTKRFADQWQGVEWRLARKPEAGLPRYPKAPRRHLIYVFPANELAHTQELWVLYSYNRDKVIVHALRFGTSDSQEEQT